MTTVSTIFSGVRAAFSDKRVRGLLAFTAMMVLIASVFYHYIEGWNMLDSVYFSVMTISTVGYGDFSPQTVLGKVFTIFYVLIGLGVFVAAASALAGAIIAARDKN